MNKRGLNFLGLSSLNTDFIEEQIAEYKKEGTLDLWKDENFRKLSRRITNILGVRNRVENCVISATTNNELTNMLARIVLDNFPEATIPKILTLSQCFMKDMSAQQDESEIRQRLYIQWVDSVRERGMKL